MPRSGTLVWAFIIHVTAGLYPVAKEKANKQLCVCIYIYTCKATRKLTVRRVITPKDERSQTRRGCGLREPPAPRLISQQPRFGAGEGIFSASFANEWHFYEAEAKQRRSPVPLLQFSPISCCCFLSFFPSFSLSSFFFFPSFFLLLFFCIDLFHLPLKPGAYLFLF